MTAAEYREVAAAYSRIIAAWEAERDALQRAADSYTPDIEELRNHQAAIISLAATVDGQERYKKRRRTG